MADYLQREKVKSVVHVIVKVKSKVGQQRLENDWTEKRVKSGNIGY